MNYRAIKDLAKFLTEKLTCLNKSSVIVFSDYSRQLKPVINKASVFNRIHFLPERYHTFDYKKERSFADIHRFNLLANYYRKYFEDVKCDYFVINALPRNSLARHAALVAAAELDSVQVVYLDHGDTGFSDPASMWHWLHYADYFYATNTEARNYARQVRDKYKENAQVLEWKRPLPKRKKEQDYVLFAPGFYNGELLIGGVTDTFKYRFVEDIVKQLNKLAIERGLRVVYKTMKGSNESFNPRSIDKFNNCVSVEYVDSGNFNKLLSRARAFVTDCVSTPLYDAVEMGVPSLCLYPLEGTGIRTTVLDMFKDCVKICKEGKDVESGLRSFFSNDFVYQHRPFINHVECVFPWR